MLTEKWKQLRIWWFIHVPFRAVKMQAWKNEYVWALQWKLNKPWVINWTKRRRVWLWWNVYCNKEQKIKWAMQLKGLPWA